MPQNMPYILNLYNFYLKKNIPLDFFRENSYLHPQNGSS